MALNKYVCVQCGKEFESYFEDVKYCCRSCYFAFRKSHAKCRVIACRVCGKEFLQARPTVEFCSVECRAESTKDQVECVCDNCGKVYTRKRSEVDRARRHYCSIECKQSDLWWSFEDTEILRQHYHNIPCNQIAKMLSVPRDNEAIRRRAQYIGLGASREWTDEETQILVDNYSNVSITELKEMLPDRTRSSIIGKARQQGLLSFFYVSRSYNSEEDTFIKNNYLSMSNSEIGAVLGRSESGIAQHLLSLDLHRPTEINSYKNLYNYVRSRMIPWRDKTLHEKNYTCELTGQKRNVVIHHIRGFNLLLQEAIENTGMPVYIDISKYSQRELDIILDEFFNLQNTYNQIVCISQDIHKKFHRIYGYGGNTAEQWKNFLGDYFTN